MTQMEQKQPTLPELIKQARQHVMTPDEEREQRIRFAYGNLAASTRHRVSKDDVRRAATAWEWETLNIQELETFEPFEIEMASLASAGVRKKLIALLFVSAEDGSEAVAYRVTSGRESRVYTSLPEAIDAYNEAAGGSS